MFTGLIEETGCIQTINNLSHGIRLTISAQQVLTGLKVGDSIAVDGACQTVISLSSSSFAVEAMAETINNTTFPSFRPGVKVNLERPLAIGQRLDGHFVSGHVDGVGSLIAKQEAVLNTRYTFSFDSSFASWIVPKGSIAINGISLTVADLQTDSFTVSLIPHSLSATNLAQINVGDKVNLEFDLLGKYLQRFWSLQNAPNASTLTLEKLHQLGF